MKRFYSFTFQKHRIKKLVYSSLTKVIKHFFEIEDFEAKHIEVKNNLLGNCSGVIHIGASTGQERDFYAEKDLNVIWVECIPEVYLQLLENISKYEKQEARNLLLGSKQNTVKFFLTSNDFMSSSIYKINKNFPQASLLQEVGEVTLEMHRFDQIFKLSDLNNFDYWVLDVQGAELDVLVGMGELLAACKILEVEISTFPLYMHAPLFEEVKDFLYGKGFIEVINPPKKYHGNLLFTR
jgi:FkbM family methyltransferase